MKNLIIILLSMFCVSLSAQNTDSTTVSLPGKVLESQLPYIKGVIKMYLAKNDNWDSWGSYEYYVSSKYDSLNPIVKSASDMLDFIFFLEKEKLEDYEILNLLRAEVSITIPGWLKYEEPKFYVEKAPAEHYWPHTSFSNESSSVARRNLAEALGQKTHADCKKLHLGSGVKMFALSYGTGVVTAINQEIKFSPGYEGETPLDKVFSGFTGHPFWDPRISHLRKRDVTYGPNGEVIKVGDFKSLWSQHVTVFQDGWHLLDAFQDAGNFQLGVLWARQKQKGELLIPVCEHHNIFGKLWRNAANMTVMSLGKFAGARLIFNRTGR